MPRRTPPLVAGATYHVYNRGNNRQVVFRSDSDYRSFLQAIPTSLGVGAAHQEPRPGTILLGYCLMPNHYHLVVQPRNRSFSSRMQRMLISYTKSVNAKYGRVGALSQRQFQAVAIGNGEQSVYLTVYVHNNPVLARLVPRAEDWEYSSRREHLGRRRATLPAPELVLDLCGAQKAYDRLLASQHAIVHPDIEHLKLED